MSDNVTTQSATPATLPDATAIAAVEASFSGDTVLAGVGVLAKSSGAEGARSLTLINPATEDKQDTGNTSLASIDGKVPALVSGRVPVDPSEVTSPVSVVSLPLPSGAATSAKQDTGNTSLASLDSKTPALGQALAAASVPVVLTAAQVSTLTPPAAITGFLTESDFDAKVGSLTETAPATDTASSGLNGRLQRIAQRLSSLIALLPTALGAGGGLKVDGSGTALPVSAASLPLPSGAATEATLATLKASLSVAAIQATASGDTTLIASGTRKLKRIEASNSHASTALTVGLKVPSINSGSTFGKKYLPAAGGLAVWVFPNGYLQATSEAVSVNLSAAGQVEFTAYYE